MLPMSVAGQSSFSPKPEISVSVALAKKEFRLGEPMALRIEITNIGQKAI
jgi:ribosomal protein L4